MPGAHAARGSRRARRVRNCELGYAHHRRQRLELHDVDHLIGGGDGGWCTDVSG